MAQAPSRPRDRHGFKIAIICALPLEAEMVESVFDRFWDEEGNKFGKADGDQNTYTTGTIGDHNVVLAHMPGMGGSNAATVAAGLRSSYRGIEVAIIVGICGVIPIHHLTKEEILLGDCIISTAVVQYDFGRQYPNQFIRKNAIEDSLGQASVEVKSLTSMLMTRRNRGRLQKSLAHHLGMLQENRSDVKYPGTDRDCLFHPSYVHQHRQNPTNCSACMNDSRVCSRDCQSIGCERDHLVKRRRLQAQQLSTSETNISLPMIHFGRFGSGNTVMKSGLDRDRIAEEEQLIAFEMEGSGVLNSFPTIVVKSACDYADSHKSKEWQPYAAATAAAGLKAILERWEVIDSPSKQEEQQQQQQQPRSNTYYMIPLLRNQRFVGREASLAELETRLLIRREARQLAIYGLGGVGKTQIALAFSDIVRTRYLDYSIFWVSALSIARFKQDYTKIAEACSIPTSASEDALISVVQSYLSSANAGKWLLIIDNADDKAILFDKDYGVIGSLPQSDRGITLFTTRYQDIAVDVAGPDIFAVEKMNIEEAETFFVNSLPRIQALQAAQDRTILKELLHALAYLPLAIAQASSYIAKVSITIAKYLELMGDTENEMVKLLSYEFWDNTRDGDTQNAIAITWLVSFSRIMIEAPHAESILFFLAFLENKAIPVSILPSIGSEGDMLYSLGILQGYSFLTSSGEGEMYEMHRLVQHAIKIWMRRQDIVHVWAARTISHLAATFPSDSWENRKLWRQYTPHAIRALQNTEEMASSERAKLCMSLGLCLRADGRVQESLGYVTECVSWRNQVLPETHFDRLQAQYHLATGYVWSGQDEEARMILENVVAIRNRLLSEHDPYRVQPQVTLARVYLRNGQVRRSIELLESVFQANGLESDVYDLTQLQVQHELAAAYLSNEQVDEALSLLEKLIAVQKLFQAEDHPSRLACQHRLGLAYMSSGQIHAAIEAFEIVIRIRTHALPPDHPDRLASQHGLAMAYMGAGRYDQAIDLMEQVVAADRRTLTRNHPDRVKSEDCLAWMHRRKQRGR